MLWAYFTLLGATAHYGLLASKSLSSEWLGKSALLLRLDFQQVKAAHFSPKRHDACSLGISPVLPKP